MFPSSLLAKIYVPQSLKNTANGFEFILKNLIDSGTIGAIKSLAVDGVEIPLNCITIITPAGERRAEEITHRSPVPLGYSAEARVTAAGQKLSAGRRQIHLAVQVLEAGKIDLKFEDDVA